MKILLQKQNQWSSNEDTQIVIVKLLKRLELIFYFTYFSPSSHLTRVCFFSVSLSLLIQNFQQVLKFLLSPGLGS